MLIILLSRTSSKNNYADLKNSIDRLNHKITNLTVHIEALKKEKEVSKEISPSVEKNEIITSPVIIEKPTTEKMPVVEELVKPEPFDKPIDEKITEPVSVNIEPPKITKPQYTVHEIHESWFEKWLRNNPDIEKFIGENLINKIGIAVNIGHCFLCKICHRQRMDK